MLGDRYGVALEKGDLKLAFEPETGSFSVWHYEHRLPLSPLTYPLVLERALAALDSLDGHGEMIAVADRLRTMSEEPFARAAGRASRPKSEALKRRLAQTRWRSRPTCTARSTVRSRW